MSLRDQNLTLFQQALNLLQSQPETLYTQAEICQKLEVLGYGLSTSLFNKIIHRPEKVSERSLQQVSEGMQQLIKLELGLRYQHGSQRFANTKSEGWTRTVVPTQSPVEDKEAAAPIFHYDGRRSIAEKTSFIAQSEEEVVVLGVRLRQFASYFTDRKDGEFKDHIVRLLEKGVNVNCYLADPNSKATWFYFEDRAKVLPKEKYGEELIHTVIKDLQEIQRAMLKAPPFKSFGLYQYRHLPTAHFLAVDPESDQGKMLVSNYIYGLPRSKVPVVEVHKAATPKLFELYYKALRAIREQAIEIEPLKQ